MSILQTIFVQDGNNETMLSSEFSLFTTQIVITEDSNQWGFICRWKSYIYNFTTIANGKESKYQ